MGARNSKALKKNDLLKLEEILGAMLKGEKPLLDPDDLLGALLIDQMQVMYEHGMLSEPYKSYMVLPDEQKLPPEEFNEIVRLKGKTTREPFPKNLTTESRYLRRMMEKREIHNFKALGEDPAFLYRKEPYEQLFQAQSFVLTPSGLSGLYQFFQYLRLAYEGSLPGTDQVFVLQNSEGFWEPLLSGFKSLIEAQPQFMITSSSHDSAEYLNKALDTRKTMKAGFDPSLHVPELGHVILLMSSNPQKLKDYRDAAAERADGVNIRDFFSVIQNHPREAEEVSYSYAGNVLEKLEALVEMIVDKGPQAFHDEIEASGLPVSKVTIMLEDQGVEMNNDLFRGPEFDYCTDERRNTYRDYGPGPELKGMINAMSSEPFKGEVGDKAFVGRIFAAHERLNEGSDDTPDIRVKEISCALVTNVLELIRSVEKALEKARENDRDFCLEDVLAENCYDIIQAEVLSKLKPEPNEERNGLEFQNFFAPVKGNGKEYQADIPDYNAHYGVPAQIYKAIGRLWGFADRRDSRYALKQSFNGIELESKKLNPFIFPEKLNEQNCKVEKLDGTFEHIKSALRCFHDYCLEQDGFVVRETNNPDNFWNEMFLTTSLLVGNQLKDTAVSGKPFVWQKGVAHEILEPFTKWLIPTRFDALCYVVDKQEDINPELQKGFYELDPAQPETHKMEVSGIPGDENLFTVTVYCSATCTNAPLKQEAREFGHDLAALGFGVKTGGGTGTDGLMVEINEGVQDAKNKFYPYLESRGTASNQMPSTHLSCHHSIKTVEAEGKYDKADYYDVAPDIYVRMDKLQQTHAEILFPGGAGSFQELAYTAIKRQSGLVDVTNRPVVIVNHNEMYDDLIAQIPQKDFEALNIHVAKDKAQALKIIFQARLNHDMEPELPYTGVQDYLAFKQDYLRQQNPDFGREFG